jgi:hypothetical protein
MGFGREPWSHRPGAARPSFARVQDSSSIDHPDRSGFDPTSEAWMPGMVSPDFSPGEYHPPIGSRRLESGGDIRLDSRPKPLPFWCFQSCAGTNRKIGQSVSICWTVHRTRFDRSSRLAGHPICRLDQPPNLKSLSVKTLFRSAGRSVQADWTRFDPIHEPPGRAAHRIRLLSCRRPALRRGRASATLPEDRQSSRRHRLPVAGLHAGTSAETRPGQRV